MESRVHGWDRATTDSVLARRFVRALFEGDADGVATLVSERCVLHRAWCDETVHGESAVVEAALELAGSTDAALETIETTVSGGQVAAAVTTSDERGSTGTPDGEERVDSPDSPDAAATLERPPFASVRVEDDRIVEVWLHAEAVDTGASRSLGSVVQRISAWLHAD